MTLHDRYARLTPYELAFPDLGRTRERFREVLREAEEADADTGEPFRLAALGTAAALVRELGQGGDDPGRLREQALLVFPAFHFWRAGERLHLVAAGPARAVVEGDVPAEGAGRLPADAGYAQLPQHLFWTDAAGQATPESLDGFFWAAPAETGPLFVLLVAGLRPERPGFSVLPVPPYPLSEARTWLRASARADGADFASDMPGADIEGLHELRTTGEALKLAAGVLALLERGPTAELPPTADAEGAGLPRPSALPYGRLG